MYILALKENCNTATTAPTQKKSVKAKHNKYIFNAPCMHLFVYKEQKWNPVQNIFSHTTMLGHMLIDSDVLLPRGKTCQKNFSYAESQHDNKSENIRHFKRALLDRNMLQ